MKKAVVVLAVAIGAVCLPAAIFVATWASIGDAPWEDEDGGATKAQATATGWSAAECADARTAIDFLKIEGACVPEHAEACIQAQIAINDNCP